MARSSHTAVPYWMEMPLLRFFRWIKTANAVTAEEERERKRQEKKR